MNEADACMAGDGHQLVYLIDAKTRTELRLIESALKQRNSALDSLALNLTYEEAKARFVCQPELEKVIEGGKRVYFAPLRLVWNTKERGDAYSIRDLIFGTRGNPGSIRQLFRSKSESAFQVIEAQGAWLSELEVRQQRKSGSIRLSDYIAKSALLALDKEERRIKGASYKVPRMLTEEVLGKPEFREFAVDYASRSDMSADSINEYARKCLKEMAATPSPRGLDLAAALGRTMYTRGFERKIDFHEEDLARIRELTENSPVAFLFTHKSHIDGFLLISLFRDLNFPPIHTFGGINMGFVGLGTLLRKAGAIFIRRTFRNDEVYKAVFRSYIDYLGEKRFPIMWALEGTRSRTGKLMPPRYGLINYVVSAYQRDDSPDLVLMPISIVYDQVPEVGDYEQLQSGGEKRPESASWFMQYISGLKMPHGKIHVRFGQGLKISDYLKIDSKSTGVDRTALQKMAFDLAVDTNRSTPPTVNSLITYVLLEHGQRAVTLNELAEQISALIRRIKMLGFQVTDDVESLDHEKLSAAMHKLRATGVIEIHDDGIDHVFRIKPDKGRRAAYYRNGLIHCFISVAIGEVALLAVRTAGDAAEQEFRAEALKIRDLMKFEFFFEPSEVFLRQITDQFDLISPAWRTLLWGGREGVEELIREFELLLGHGSLRPFFEAYLVFARALMLVPAREPIHQKPLFEKCLALGKQRILQQRIHSEESISSAYFENALRIAEIKGLLDEGESVASKRLTFRDELLRITENIRYLASAMDLKRAERRNLRLQSQHAAAVFDDSVRVDPQKTS